MVEKVDVIGGTGRAVDPVTVLATGSVLPGRDPPVGAAPVQAVAAARAAVTTNGTGRTRIIHANPRSRWVVGTRCR